jgi:hypothetical protein
MSASASLVDRGVAVPFATDVSRRPAFRSTSITHPQRARSRRQRGAGRSVAPRARPCRSVPPPRLGGPAHRSVVAKAAPQWRLTERGIAVIVVLALLITLVAAVVVFRTALQVTDSAMWRPVASSLSAG